MNCSVSSDEDKLRLMCYRPETASLVSIRYRPTNGPDETIASCRLKKKGSMNCGSDAIANITNGGPVQFILSGNYHNNSGIFTCQFPLFMSECQWPPPAKTSATTSATTLATTSAMTTATTLATTPVMTPAATTTMATPMTPSVGREWYEYLILVVVLLVVLILLAIRCKLVKKIKKTTIWNKLMAGICKNTIQKNDERDHNIAQGTELVAIVMPENSQEDELDLPARDDANCSELEGLMTNRSTTEEIDECDTNIAEGKGKVNGLMSESSGEEYNPDVSSHANPAVLLRRNALEPESDVVDVEGHGEFDQELHNPREED